jgi:hypothetical protein
VPAKKAAIAVDQLEATIHEVRGHRVMFDADLAKLYGVDSPVLVQAVQRNKQRFPDGFSFQLSKHRG